MLPTKQPPKRNADRSVRVASTATEAFFSAASAWAAFARTQAGAGSVSAGVGSGGRRQLGRPASLGRTASAWASGSGVGRPASARALGVGSEGGVGYLGRLRLGAAAVGARRAAGGVGWGGIGSGGERRRGLGRRGLGRCGLGRRRLGRGYGARLGRAGRWRGPELEVVHEVGARRGFCPAKNGAGRVRAVRAVVRGGWGSSAAGLPGRSAPLHKVNSLA